MDLDGDRRPDLVVHAPADDDGTAVFGNGDDAHWRVYRGTGSGFESTWATWDVPDDDLGGAGFYQAAQGYYTTGFWTTMDLGGDGGLDLVLHAPADDDGTQVFGLGTGEAYWRIWSGE